MLLGPSRASIIANRPIQCLESHSRHFASVWMRKARSIASRGAEPFCEGSEFFFERMWLKVMWGWQPPGHSRKNHRRCSPICTRLLALVEVSLCQCHTPIDCSICCIACGVSSVETMGKCSFSQDRASFSCLCELKRGQVPRNSSRKRKCRKSCTCPCLSLACIFPIFEVWKKVAWWLRALLLWTSHLVR